MKYFILLLPLLFGCTSRATKMRSCYEGAMAAITAIKKAGGFIPDGTQEQVLSDIEATCEK